MGTRLREASAGIVPVSRTRNVKIGTSIHDAIAQVYLHAFAIRPWRLAQIFSMCGKVAQVAQDQCISDLPVYDWSRLSNTHKRMKRLSSSPSCCKLCPHCLFDIALTPRIWKRHPWELSINGLDDLVADILSPMLDLNSACDCSWDAMWVCSFHRRSWQPLMIQELMR